LVIVFSKPKFNLKNRSKPAFNVRRPGEGEGDKKEWKGLVPLARQAPAKDEHESEGAEVKPFLVW